MQREQNQGAQEAGEACCEDLLHGRVPRDDSCEGGSSREHHLWLPPQVCSHVQCLPCRSSAARGALLKDCKVSRTEFWLIACHLHIYCVLKPPAQYAVFNRAGQVSDCNRIFKYVVVSLQVQASLLLLEFPALQSPCTGQQRSTSRMHQSRHSSMRLVIYIEGDLSSDLSCSKEFPISVSWLVTPLHIRMPHSNAVCGLHPNGCGPVAAIFSMMSIFDNIELAVRPFRLFTALRPCFWVHAHALLGPSLQPCNPQ